MKNVSYLTLTHLREALDGPKWEGLLDTKTLLARVLLSEEIASNDAVAATESMSAFKKSQTMKRKMFREGKSRSSFMIKAENKNLSALRLKLFAILHCSGLPKEKLKVFERIKAEYQSGEEDSDLNQILVTLAT